MTFLYKYLIIKIRIYKRRINYVYKEIIKDSSCISTPSNPSNTAFKSTVSNILGVVQFICYAAAVILLVILGIKFMTASPDGKAEVKKSAVIYVVGAVMVFAAGAVLNLVKNLLGDTIKES